MTRIIETTVYTLDEHPNPEAVYEWLRESWYDIGDRYLEEMVESLEAFASAIGAKVDWSLSISPDRGEYVRFHFSDGGEPDISDLLGSLDLSGNCPFTGMFYDETILDAFREAVDTDQCLQDVLQVVEHNVLKTLHNEGEYLYSDESIYEICIANEYEFTTNGEVV